MSPSIAGLAPTPERTLARTFVDDGLQEQMDRLGYVVVPFWDAAEVEALAAEHDRLHPTGHGFDTDYARKDPTDRRELAELLMPYWKRGFDRVLDDHRAVSTSFLVKWPDADSEMLLHRDWSYVDESHLRSVAVWVPLVDVNVETDNGPIGVLPGSHRFFDGWRSVSIDSWYDHYRDYITSSLVPVPVPAGHTLVLDNKLLHASPPNRSPFKRVAVATVGLPRLAQAVHVAGSPGRFAGPASVLAVDDSFFIDRSPGSLRDWEPIGIPIVDQVWWSMPDVDRATLAALCRREELPVDELFVPRDAHREPAGPVPASPGGFAGAACAAVARRLRGRVGGPDGADSIGSGEALAEVVRAEWAEAQARSAVVADPVEVVPTGERVLDIVRPGGALPSASAFPRTLRELERLGVVHSARVSVVDPHHVVTARRAAVAGVVQVAMPIDWRQQHSIGTEMGGRLVRHDRAEPLVIDPMEVHVRWNVGDHPAVWLEFELVRDLPGWRGRIDRVGRRLITRSRSERRRRAWAAELQVASGAW